MGEISDALRRAKTEGDSRPGPARKRGRDEAESAGPTYSRAIEVATPSELAESSFSEVEERVADVQISRERRGNWAARTVAVDHEDGRAESYRHFAIRLARETERKRIRSVMVVSALRREGKTTTSCNLAMACASIAGGRRTALLDLDLRRPSIAHSLEIEPRIGFEAVLEGNASLEEACLRTDLGLLDVYPVAAPISQPHEVLADQRVAEMFLELERRYDTIIVDTPPLLLVPDAELLFKHVAGAVAVLRARMTRREPFRRVVGMIPEGKLLGSFMNDCRPSQHSKQSGYYSADGAKAEPQST